MIYALTSHSDRLLQALEGYELCCAQLRSSLFLSLQEEDLQKADGVIFDMLDADFSRAHILSAVQQIRARHETLPVAVILGFDAEGRYGQQIRHALEKTFRCTVLTGSEGLETLQEMFVMTKKEEAPEKKPAAASSELPQASADKFLEFEKIVVAGALPRCGCTTQALALCRCLQEWGALPILMESVPLFAAEGGIQTIAGVPVAGAETPVPRGSIVVHDAGVVRSQEQLKQLQRNTPVILCSGSKPWEFMALAQLLRGNPCCDGLIVSFDAAAGGLEHVQSLMPCPLLSAPWRPDLLIKKTEEGMDVFLRQVLKFMRQEEKR